MLVVLSLVPGDNALGVGTKPFLSFVQDAHFGGGLTYITVDIYIYIYII